MAQIYSDKSRQDDPHMRTLEQWEYLAKCSVRNVTEDNAKAIAQLCYETELNGGKASIWHMSTIVHKNETCPCADCRGLK